jgi:hypothetical protein
MPVEEFERGLPDVSRSDWLLVMHNRIFDLRGASSVDKLALEPRG